MVMAVLLLDYYKGGNTGKAAAFSLVQTALLAVLIGVATWLFRGSTNTSGGRAGWCAWQKREESRHENDFDRARPCERARSAGGRAGFRSARADRRRQEGRQARLLHRELRGGRAGGDQGLQQALPRNQGPDGARSGGPAHHPRSDG